MLIKLSKLIRNLTIQVDAAAYVDRSLKKELYVQSSSLSRFSTRCWESFPWLIALPFQDWKSADQEMLTAIRFLLTFNIPHLWSQTHNTKTLRNYSHPWLPNIIPVHAYPVHSIIPHLHDHHKTLFKIPSKNST